MKHPTPRPISWVVTLLALVFTLNATMYAQTAVDGAIGGTVLDSSGAVVSGATIVVHNAATNAEQTVLSDGSGYFRVVHLAPAVYNVTVSATGFETFKSTAVTVQVGLLTNIQVKLVVGSAAQSVEVTGEAPQVNTTSPDFSNVVDQLTLHDLPENNYRWSTFALLTPGVVNDSNGYGLLSFRGQSTLLNNVTIDGTDDNEAYWSEERGRTRAGYSTIKAAVQEFQVNTSNYSVEYGRSAGGIVNSITKSGTNSIHGEAYYYDRDSAWAAQNQYVTHPVQISSAPVTYGVQSFKPTDLRRQFGFGAGGPLLKDKLFWYLAADKYYHDFPAAATIISASANSNFYTTNGSYAQAQITQLAKATGMSTTAATAYYQAGINNLTSMLGAAPRTGDQTIYFPKLDYQLNDKNHVSVEANRMRWTSPAGIQTSPAVAYGKESFGNDYVRDNWIVGKLDSFITKTVSNEVRYMYSRDFEYENNQTPTSYEQTNLVKTPAGYTNPLGLPPNVYLSGFFQFGTPQFLNRAALPDERRYQIADTVNWIRGNHSIKIGEDFLHTNDNISNLYNQFGGYSYSGNTPLGNYLADLYLSQNPVAGKMPENYSYYSQGAGPAGLDFNTEDYALFVQDEWRVSPRLSLTMGVRWEFEQFPSQQLKNPLLPQTNTLHDDPANVGPRVGFAYDVFGGGRTILRGGYGMFFARAINSTLYQALINSGSPSGQTNPRLNPGTSCAPLFPQVVAPSNFASCLGGSSGNATAYYIDHNFKVPEIHQADLTIEHQITKSDAASVSWLGSWGRRLPDFVDTNLPTPTPITLTVNSTSGPLANGAAIHANAYFQTSTNNNHRPNGNFTNITDIFSGVTSNYNALVAEFSHRLAQNFSLTANYTWSHALDYGENNFTGAASTAMLDPSNIRLDYGNSNQNVPYRFTIYGVATSPWRFHGPLAYLLNNYELAPDLQMQSGLPYSVGINGSSSKLYPDGSTTQQYIVSFSSFNGSGASSANRVPGFDRNAFQQPRTVNVDLRMSKSISVKELYKLEFLAEAFNLANHQNVTGIGSTAYVVTEDTTNHLNTLTPYTNTPFQSITSTDNSNFAYNVRQLQMALRLTF